MSESIKRSCCELYESSSRNDSGKVEMLSPKETNDVEACKHLNGACTVEFARVAIPENKSEIKHSTLGHVLDDGYRTSTTPLRERSVEQKCADDHHDTKVADNTKSVVDTAEKVTHDGLGESHVPEKTAVGEPIVVKDPIKESSGKEVSDYDFLKKSLVKDVIEEPKLPKCEDSVKKAGENIESEKSLKSDEICSDRASDGSMVSGNEQDKIVNGSEVTEPLVDGSDTKSVKDKDEYLQKIVANVEEKVDDGKKVDKDEISEGKISESKAADSQKVASVKDESPEEVSVKCEVSNKNTVSDIEQQDKSDLTKKSKDNE